MAKKNITYLFSLLILIFACERKESATEILRKTIESIDTIKTVQFKQQMRRSNPRNIKDTLVRYREMVFTRLISDSIVGVKGHWYMYLSDSIEAVYEDIFDGNRLVRINNPDSLARLYDLVKYPAFKEKHFWSHNTPFGMQYEYKYMLENGEYYGLERLNDTIIEGINCYQIKVLLENQMSLPGFATSLEAYEGLITDTRYYINKETYYPLGVKAETYLSTDPRNKTFIEQHYYDLLFNDPIKEELQYNTSLKSLSGFETIEMKP